MEQIGKILDGYMNQPPPTEEMVPIDDYSGNYGANPYCKKCHGAGFVHPTGYHGTPIYSQVVPCDAPGCLLESARDYRAGDPRR